MDPTELKTSEVGSSSTSNPAFSLKPIAQKDLEILGVLRGNIERIEALASHEYALIGNRMVWFAISQSFLFGSYATIATDSIRLTSMFVNQPSGAPGALTGRLLLLVVPLVGLLFAYAALRSVGAASDVLKVLDPARGKILTQANEILLRYGFDPLPVIGNSNQRKSFDTRLGTTIFRGNFPQWVLPSSMIVVWLGTVVIRVPWLMILQTLTSP
ncbi:MAG: hypothetical protein ACK449_03815 [Planctomycetota bacterium]|jgi:hypothetical protein